MSTIRPFSNSQCHHCQHLRYIHTRSAQQVYLMCRADARRYLPQPQTHCMSYQAAPLLQLTLHHWTVYLVSTVACSSPLLIQPQVHEDPVNQSNRRSYHMMTNTEKTESSPLSCSSSSTQSATHISQALVSPELIKQHRQEYKGTTHAFFFTSSSHIYWSQIPTQDAMFAYLLPSYPIEILEQISYLLLTLKHEKTLSLTPVFS